LSFSFLSENTGPPSEENCYADIEAAYEYLRNELNVPAQNIVLYGRSLGSGPSTHLAIQTALASKKSSPEIYGCEDGPVGGLILHAPFLSVFRVVLDTGCTLYGDKFPNIDLIPMVKSSTMLIHGTSDQIVPFHHSERLYTSIPSEYRARPLYIEGMSHNNVHSQVRPMFVDRLCEYLEQHVWPSAVVTKNHSSSSHNNEPTMNNKSQNIIMNSSSRRSGSPPPRISPSSSKVRKRVRQIVEAPAQHSQQLSDTDDNRSSECEPLTAAV
jgi:abhydrolase domain-containing protein 17